MNHTTNNQMAPAWPIQGVRVEDDNVIVTVKGGNDAARWLCGELVALIDGQQDRAALAEAEVVAEKHPCDVPGRCAEMGRKCDRCSPIEAEGQAVQREWKWVPVEPTPEMFRAACWFDTPQSRGDYARLIAAAPEAPAAPAAWQINDGGSQYISHEAYLANGWFREEYTIPLYTRPPAPREPVEFTASARSALLWVLWHHQGGSSPVGQPIRYALGMGRHDDLTEAQLSEAKRWGDAHPVNPSVYPRGEGLLTGAQKDRLFDNAPPVITNGMSRTDFNRLVQFFEAVFGIGTDREGG